MGFQMILVFFVCHTLWGGSGIIRWTMLQCLRFQKHNVAPSILSGCVSDSDSMISLINGNGVVVNVQLVLVQNQQSSIASSLLNSSLFGWCGPISDSRLQAFQPFLDSWQKPKIFQKGWNPAVRVLWKKSRRIHVVPACNSLEMSMRTRVGIILPRFFLKWCSSRPRTVIIYVHCTNVCMGGIWITSSARARPTQQTMMIEWSDESELCLIISMFCDCFTICPISPALRQDAPVEFQSGPQPLLVSATKGDEAAMCIKCFYIKRGSFPNMKQRELLKCLQKSQPLRKKQLDLQSTAKLVDCNFHPKMKNR